jgi:hypothetical protein
MLRKIARLFVIMTRFEACLVIYALAIGASQRGSQYLLHLPDVRGVIWPAHSGQMLFIACMGAVALAGARIFDAIRADHEIDALKAEIAELRARQA